MSATFSHSPRFSTTIRLSLAQTALLHARWMLKGVIDSSKWSLILSSVTEDAELRTNVLQSLVINGLALLTINMFTHVVAAADGQQRFQENAVDLYHLIWSLPLISVSAYMNAILCARTSKRAFILVHGSRSYVESMPATGPLLSRMAVAAPRMIMLFISFALDVALRYIPIVGIILAFLFLAWVDAYYFFEFTWTGRGMPLAQRVQHLEERWSYYLGFGLTSAILLTVASGSPLSNTSLFALIYPVHIILATNARPQPADPHDLSSFASSDTPTSLSPILPGRLPVLTIALWLDRLALSLLHGLDVSFMGGRAGVGKLHQTQAHYDDAPLSAGARVLRNQFAATQSPMNLSGRSVRVERSVGGVQGGQATYASGPPPGRKFV